MGAPEEAIQLIDESKQFNGKTLQYFSRCLSGRNVGTKYHVISVFGSQSSGKSTLLNKLFSTKFDTMDAQVKRQQTTKGIWLSHAEQICSSQNSGLEVPDFFVLDVEGSDGAERGEDQDFERKAALFALSVSEVLIVNMWENQIGLYQGNNMGLLKTVFEVNLSLFGKSENHHKVALLFVIRDFTGQTPLESLEITLVHELEKMWAQLSKPQGCEETTFHDFFVPKFIGLGHKVFQPEQFDKDVKELGDMFVDKDLSFFKPEYHTNLPLDGWALYAENCWDQIEHNKDLDLPTQQILVARFKTDEIATTAYNKFIADYDNRIKSTMTGDELASTLNDLQSTCIERDYDPFASRYAEPVYEERRVSLVEQITTKIDETINEYINKSTKSLIENFVKGVKDKSVKKPLKLKIEIGVESTLQSFKENLKPFTAYGFISDVTAFETRFKELIDTQVTDVQERELEQIVARFNKALSTKLKDTILHSLSKPTVSIWDDIMEEFNKFVDGTFKKYTSEDGSIDFQVGASEEAYKSTAETMKKNAWAFLEHTIHVYLTEDNIVDILRSVFLDRFRYDEDGMPIFWKNENEVDSAYRLALSDSLNVLDSLAIIKTKDNVEILYPVDLLDVVSEDTQSEDSDDDSDLDRQQKFSHILSDLQKAKIVSKFKQFADLTIIEAKRSIVNTTERIPLYMYALVVALGWGKILSILRNPVTIFLSMIVIAVTYVIYKLNLWGPLLQFANQATGQATATLKQTLRDLVADEEPRKKVPVESYELKEKQGYSSDQKKHM